MRQLHPESLQDPEAIDALLRRLATERVPLRRGVNRRIQAEVAIVEDVEDSSIRLRLENFEPRNDGLRSFPLSFELDGQPYSFLANPVGSIRAQRLEVAIPTVIHLAERRDRVRTSGASGWVVRVLDESGRAIDAEVADYSPGGLGLQVPEDRPLRSGSEVTLRFLSGPNPGSQAVARVQSLAPARGAPGWARLGLKLHPRDQPCALPIEERNRILPGHALQRVWRNWRVVEETARAASGNVVRRVARRSAALPTIQLADYKNEAGERLVSIIDSYGETRGAPAIIIAPAWGRTKETLLPLARTIVAAFGAARQPVVVVRFDGIRKRGESHNDPDCRAPGTEQHRFTFSQGVRDVFTTLDFLEQNPDFGPSKTALVTFSAASIEGRAVMALDRGQRLAGWISVVGSADLQSMMRVISGGVDFMGGVERGVRFGLQEILGVEVDIDAAAQDAMEHQMAFIEDARRDFASIRAPITWFHGMHDAWMNLERVRDVMAHGLQDKRRLIVIPTGHRLKTSREALQVFQAIAIELGRSVLDRKIPAAVPDMTELAARQAAERARLPERRFDLREFWKNYLVGRDELLGIELMASTAAYRTLMAAQIQSLDLGPGLQVLDLGSGIGSFPLQLAELGDDHSTKIWQLDYVRAALERARLRLGERCSGIRSHFVECNLDVSEGRPAVPLRSGSFDRILASLLLSYVADPERLLREAHRILRPGGRIVLSTLRPDADISKIYTEGLKELVSGTSHVAHEPGTEAFDASVRSFLNDAARLLDLEEFGVFRFWEAKDLERLVRRCGFTRVRSQAALGDPPQATMLWADRP